MSGYVAGVLVGRLPVLALLVPSAGPTRAVVGPAVTSIVFAGNRLTGNSFPMIAAAVKAASSLFVVTSSLRRLRRFRGARKAAAG